MPIVQPLLDTCGRPIQLGGPMQRFEDRARESLRKEWKTPNTHDQVAPIIQDPYAHCYDARADAGDHMGLIGKPVKSTWGIPSTTPDSLPPVEEPLYIPGLDDPLPGTGRKKSAFSILEQSASPFALEPAPLKSKPYESPIVELESHKSHKPFELEHSPYESTRSRKSPFNSD